MMPSSRILLAFLLMVEVAHVADDLLQTFHPLLRLLFVVCHQVQSLLTALKDDGETPLFLAGVRVFVKPLGLPTFTHGVDVVDGDCW